MRDTERLRSTFIGNGWVNNGDVFVQDERDYFWYRGRADDMVKVSGVWVSLAEIERCLEKHPSVKERIVLGLEDKGRLTITKAFVALHHGVEASRETAGALRDFCKKNSRHTRGVRHESWCRELTLSFQCAIVADKLHIGGGHGSQRHTGEKTPGNP